MTKALIDNQTQRSFKEFSCFDKFISLSNNILSLEIRYFYEQSTSYSSYVVTRKLKKYVGMMTKVWTIEI